MEKETLEVALASLVGEPGLANGWQSDIVQWLKDPIEKYGGISAVAARLSAGISSPVENSPRLKNILASIGMDEKQRQSASYFFKPATLGLQEDIFFPEENQSGNDQDAIQKIVNEIKQSLPKSYKEDEGFLEEVLSVLHRTTSNLPSTYSSDVSYYDQQRMTAALAVCLLEKNEKEIPDYIKSSDKYKDEPITLLVGGDISGIQDFIYTITAKGAAKSLRGRSFYLQLLTEAVLRFVLRKLKIPYTNIIYSGGGHFFLLAPLSAVKELNKIQEEITKAILKHHGTSLYLALGWAEVPVSGFFDGKFPEYWGAMHGDLARKKQKRYSELATNSYKQVFEPRKFGGNPEDTCDACKEDHRKTTPWAESNDIQDRICTLCGSFIEEIGKKLPNNSFVALGFNDPKPSAVGKASDVLAEFGMTVQFFTGNKEDVDLGTKHTVIWSLDDLKKDLPAKADHPKWIRYTARQVPRNEKREILAFDDLQEKVAGGFERLGVLRMDVDNLGELFKNGFGKNSTLTRLASLSFRISLFFEGWLKKICEENENIYTVYSGGDDVFLIGPWDVMPALAQKIEHDFARYSSENTNVHISAGMAFIDGKYPVYQAAEDAEKAIDDAKDMDGKNGFTFLGRSWKWVVFNEIATKQKKLSDLVKPASSEKKPAPQALLQVLQQLALEEEGHKKQNGLHVWGRWIWMGMYQLTRMGDQNSSIAEDIRSIRDELAGSSYKEINQWGVAARWSQLKERKKSK